MSVPSPFHAGEQTVQTQLGVRAEIEPWARKVVRSTLPEQHREFYAELPFLVAAARDADGQPWATLLTGAAGFAHSPHPGALRIDALPPASDPLVDSIVEGSDLGLLGLEFSTRRRNRLNGHVSHRDEKGLELAVGQAFGNCPQYIHERGWRSVPVVALKTVPVRHLQLTRHFREIIETADTFFIATGYRGEGESAAYGMDASHRGGDPGFVRVDSAQSLVFPDYAGNNHFNTVGNLLMDPRVGLLFVDFAAGNLLQLTGRARIENAGPQLAQFPGAQRLIHFQLAEVLEQIAVIPLRWDSQTHSGRELRIASKLKESADVTSFVLEPVAGGELDSFMAGQHLPVKLEIPGHDAAVDRTYSLSNDPRDPYYRITVKRESMGTVSRHLHDVVEVGDTLIAGAPAGDFTLAKETSRPSVLLSAGVGITPMVSMLHTLIDRGETKPIWFIHGARNSTQHPLDEEVRNLAEAAPNVKVRVSYSRPLPGDVTRDADHLEGRVDGDRLDALLNSYEADFYLCGPRKWMAAIYEHLEQRDVSPERIHSESFGPVA